MRGERGSGKTVAFPVEESSPAEGGALRTERFSKIRYLVSLRGGILFLEIFLDQLFQFNQVILFVRFHSLPESVKFLISLSILKIEVVDSPETFAFLHRLR